MLRFLEAADGQKILRTANTGDMFKYSETAETRRAQICNDKRNSIFCNTVFSFCLYNFTLEGGLDKIVQVEIGSQAPGFRLPAASGGEVSLSDYRDKANVAIFFVREYN